MISYIVNLLIQLFSFIILIYILLSYFMRPDHQIRIFVDGIVNPLLNPIRRIVPSVMGLDFSPVVLMLLVSAVGNALVRILYSAGL